MFNLQFVSACGMSFPSEHFDSFKDAMENARKILYKRIKRGYPIGLTEKYPKSSLGNAAIRVWHIEESDNCHLIPDEVGDLILTRSMYPCEECNQYYDAREDAKACCREVY